MLKNLLYSIYDFIFVRYLGSNYKTTFKYLVTMKKRELKKLAKEFSSWMTTANNTPEQAIREFWAAKFSVSNEEREAELLEYWRAN